MVARKDGKIRSDSKLFNCWDKAVSLYQAGFSTVEIGKKFNVDPSNVYRDFMLHGIKIRNRSESVKLAFRRGRGNKGTGCSKHNLHSAGYILTYVPNHPRANCKGYVQKSLLVAEECLNRKLKLDELVHHIDNNKTNNAPSNLLVLTRSKHSKLHVRQGDMVGLKLGPKCRGKTQRRRR